MAFFFPLFLFEPNQWWWDVNWESVSFTSMVWISPMEFGRVEVVFEEIIVNKINDKIDSCPFAYGGTCNACDK